MYLRVELCVVDVVFSPQACRLLRCHVAPLQPVHERMRISCVPVLYAWNQQEQLCEFIDCLAGMLTNVLLAVLDPPLPT